MSLVVPALVAVANVLGAGMIVPQVIRLHRRRTTTGLSGPWIGVGIAMNTWWIAYAVQGRLWGIAPVSAASLVLYLIIAAQYANLEGRRALLPVAGGAVALGSVPLAALIVSGWPGAGVAIGAAYAVQFAPAAVSAIRAAAPTGVSPTTWTMAWAEAVIWFGYGIHIGDAALVIGGIGGAAMATVIVARITAFHASYRTAVPPISPS